MKWSCFLTIIFTLLLSNSCGSNDHEDKQPKNEQALNYFRRRYQPIWELLSLKYSLDVATIEKISLAYMHSYDPSHYYLVTKGKLSSEDEQEVKDNYTKERSSNELRTLVANLSHENNLTDSLTANVIFDFILLDTGNKLSDDVNSSSEGK